MTDYKGTAHDAQRIKALERQRALEKEEFERRKNEIERKNSAVDFKNISSKFAVTYDRVEDQLKKDTVGLVHLEDFTKKRESLVQQAELEKIAKQKKEQEESKKRKRKKPDVVRSTLSFSILDDDGNEPEEKNEDEEKDEEEEHKLTCNPNPNGNVKKQILTPPTQSPAAAAGSAAGSAAAAGTSPCQDQSEIEYQHNGCSSTTTATTSMSTTTTMTGTSFSTIDDTVKSLEPPAKKKKIVKNPHVDTSFLPDEEREQRELEEREAIRKEWLEQQEKIKEEPIQVTYSFWDGTGHRRSVMLTKGTTVERFLDTVRHEFKELARLTPDQLIFIKEDLIIPSHYSFYDLIVTKARGKSGPLFHWDVHDDIRLQSDASKEKEESHAGKVVERRWYERNKHIFPASRWEVYDPNKKFEKYTIK